MCLHNVLGLSVGKSRPKTLCMEQDGCYCSVAQAAVSVNQRAEHGTGAVYQLNDSRISDKLGIFSWPGILKYKADTTTS